MKLMLPDWLKTTDPPSWVKISGKLLKLVLLKVGKSFKEKKLTRVQIRKGGKNC